ncbi:MAG TPA: protease complex subunit PrcB family protein [Ignavibacteria bacterium]|nr:protease complex subunit PrcB family protein [Ignavibacteria bacterium]
MSSKEYGEVYYKSIASGTNAGFSEKYQTVIYNKDAFIKLWNDTYSNHTNKPSIPPINFENQMVVAVYFGFYSTGGASIKINGVSINDLNMKIDVLQTLPGPNCVTTDVITYPFDIVVIPKYKGEIIYNFVDKKNNCP